ncbi:MAG TPA: YidB family protein [Acidobacteriaceae bacterium]|nr:YidB family protein [Acidobacteriaceae bacterium]
MGFGSIVENLATKAGGGSEAAKVVGGLMSELQSRPGGFGELLQSFHQNGMGSQVQQWSNGQTQPADPSEIEKGLSGSGIVEAIAQKTGMSPSTVQSVLSKAVPVLMHHLVANGHVTPQGQPTGPAPNSEDLLRSVLGRIL